MVETPFGELVGRAAQGLELRKDTENNVWARCPMCGGTSEKVDPVEGVVAWLVVQHTDDCRLIQAQELAQNARNN